MKQITGLLVFFAGLVALQAAPSGVNAWTVSCLGVALAGVLILFFGGLFKASRQVKKAEINNIWRGALAVLSMFAIVGGMLVIMIYYLGHIEDLKIYIKWAFSGVIGGAFGFYYGYGYQQSAELVKMAEELGFEPADTGMTTPDGQYDIKGFVNEVETLADMEQQDPGKHSPPNFILRILCRVPNRAGTELSVSPEGLVSKISGGGLQVSYWDAFTVRTNSEEAVLRLLPLARQARENVFLEKYGFRSMELKGEEFRFVFKHEGYFEYRVEAAQMRKILEECSRLARGFF